VQSIECTTVLRNAGNCLGLETSTHTAFGVGSWIEGVGQNVRSVQIYAVFSDWVPVVRWGCNFTNYYVGGDYWGGRPFIYTIGCFKRLCQLTRLYECFVQGDQKVSVRLTFVLSSGVQRLFDQPVQYSFVYFGRAVAIVLINFNSSDAVYEGAFHFTNLEGSIIKERCVLTPELMGATPLRCAIRQSRNQFVVIWTKAPRTVYFNEEGKRFFKTEVLCHVPAL